MKCFCSNFYFTKFDKFLTDGLVANNWFIDGYGLHLSIFVLILKEFMKMQMSYGCTVD